MIRLVESIREFGVREPGLVRTRKDVGYELIAGNRRRRACELAGLTEMPVIIRKMDNDNSAIAFVYKMKLDSLNPAVELSYLSIKEQMVVVNYLVKYQIKPSLSQAVNLKKLKLDASANRNSHIRAAAKLAAKANHIIVAKNKCQ